MGRFDGMRPLEIAPTQRPPSGFSPAPVAGTGVAIAGAGLMGRWHAQAARRLGARVLGVADPDPARARSVAGAGVPVFADVREMIEAVGPAVLHVCTPSATHEALIGEAIAGGIHVLAEKPLAADAAATRRLCDVAAQGGVRLCPVHQYAFQKAVAQAVQERGRLGELQMVEMDFFSAGAAGADREDHLRIAADILPHPASIAQRLWPERPLGTIAWEVRPAGAGGWEISGVAGTALLRITLSLAARPTRAGLRLWGTRGAWEVDLFHGYALFRDGAASRGGKIARPFRDSLGHLGRASANLAVRALRREPAYPGLRTLTRAFYDAAEGRGPLPIGAEEAVAVAALRDLFLARARTRSRS